MQKLTHFQLIKEILHHRKLANKRALAYEQSKMSTIFSYFSLSFIVLYLMFLAVMFALIANESKRYSGTEIMFCMMPIILIVDFLVRFLNSNTPTQLIKPYTLLPISKYICIEAFILSVIKNSGNYIWMALFIPYSIMSVLFSQGFFITITFLLQLQMLIWANALFYMLSRALINTKFIYWIIPIILYGIIFTPTYITSKPSIEHLDFYLFLGKALNKYNFIYVFATALWFIFLIYLNKKIQYNLIKVEMSQPQKLAIKKVHNFSFFDRFETYGEYLKLEVKGLLRNKNQRKTFLSSVITIFIFSLILSFTDIYDKMGMLLFWCVYDFVAFGMMYVTRIMSYEGNFIGCLMTREYDIKQMLFTKYYIYSILLIIPLLLLIPTIIVGKCTFLMLISIALFTAGPVYFGLFHYAIYNKQTIPLNSKLVGKELSNMGFISFLSGIVALTAPIAIIYVLTFFINEIIAYYIIATIGFIFILTHKLWISYIYNRLIKRKHTNIEGFYSTRT